MTGPRIRKALESIPTYKAGKPPAGRLAGDAVEASPAYKLSSNENPYPPLPPILRRAIEVAASFNRYPDMGVSSLYAALAAKLNVRQEQLATGTGSVAVLYHLLQALCSEGDEVVYAWRSFEAYPIAVGLTGARAVQVPLDRDSRHDLAAIAESVTPATKAVLVCTPNNPTGPAVHHGELAALIEAIPDDVVIVVDEAYREFVRDPDAADGLALAAGRDNVVVIRTFAKAYGLAGLRLGYAVAPARLAEAVRKCALPFGVSSIAEAAAVASLEPAVESALLARVAAIVEERTRVLAALRGQGWEVPDAQGNFVWLPLGDNATGFAAACDEAGVSVRPFPGDGVRVSVGEPAANDIVLSVAAEWVERHS